MFVRLLAANVKESLPTGTTSDECRKRLFVAHSLIKNTSIKTC
ncbi:hypothetical protein [Halobacillus faecis]